MGFMSEVSFTCCQLYTNVVTRGYAIAVVTIHLCNSVTLISTELVPWLLFYYPEVIVALFSCNVRSPPWLGKRLWVHVPCAVMNVCLQNWGSSQHQKIHGNGRLHEKRSFQWSRSALGCKSPGLKTLKYAFYIHCFHDLCTDFHR